MIGKLGLVRKRVGALGVGRAGKGGEDLAAQARARGQEHVAVIAAMADSSERPFDQRALEIAGAGFACFQRGRAMLTQPRVDVTCVVVVGAKL